MKNSAQTNLTFIDQPKLILLTVIMILAGIAYSPILPALQERFDARDSYYSHGYLIPFIFAYLIYRKHKRLASISLEPNFYPILLVISSLFIHLIGFIFKINFISYFSLPLFLMSLSLTLFGKKWFKELFFPILFLFFMLPLPQIIMIGFTFKMKIWASLVSVKILQFCGLDLTIKGSQILYPKGSLWVGDPCSGIRSLITFLALGAFIVQVTSGSLLKKSALFFSVVPIAFISNVCRIIVLTLSSYIYGAKVTDQYVHDPAGIMVFIIGFLGLMTITRILKCPLILDTLPSS